MEKELRMGPTEWAILLLLSLLWGASFFFAKVALGEVQPFTLVLYRLALASAALFVFIKLTRQSVPLSRDIWSAFIIMGLLNNIIPFSLIFYGQTQIGAGLASILNATVPIFTVLVAHCLTTDERITSYKLAGVALGVAGVAVLIGVDALKGFDLTILAMAGCLGASLSYAFAAIYGRQFKRRKLNPVSVAFGQVTASTIIIAPLVFVIDAPLRIDVLSPSALSAIIALGLFSTALAYVLFFQLLARSGATNMSLVTFLIPVSGVLLGVLFLNEQLETNHIAGFVLIGLGLGAIDGRLIDWIRTSRSYETN